MSATGKSTGAAHARKHGLKHLPLLLTPAELERVRKAAGLAGLRGMAALARAATLAAADKIIEDYRQEVGSVQTI